MEIEPRRISEKDIQLFLEQKSDFAFEAKAARIISKLGFQVEHGGTYVDTVTQKIRQFDIRARLSDEAYFSYVSVECKNLKKEAPLIIHCVPRKVDESFHDVVYVRTQIESSLPFLGPAMNRADGQIRRYKAQESLYEKRQPVGKAMDQISKNNKGEFSGKDTEVFEKMSQTLSSALSFIREVSLVRISEQGPSLHAVVPFLVIPDGTLWQVNYSEDGNIIKGPHQVEHIPFYVNRTANELFSGDTSRFKFSHLDIVTETKLPNVLKSYFINDENYDFPLVFGDRKRS